VKADKEYKMKLRAHHIYCLPFLRVDLSERGKEYIQGEDKVKQTMRRSVTQPVTLIHGVDELCEVCPLCQDSRCQSKLGDEEEVRKWDAKIMKELGVTDGATLTAVEWRKLIGEKFPLTFCNRCKAKDFCYAGDRIE
jgi:hypothetical protein